jgi:hypothetical protein
MLCGNCTFWKEYYIAVGYINNLLNYQYRHQERAFQPSIVGRVFHYNPEHVPIHPEALYNILDFLLEWRVDSAEFVGVRVTNPLLCRSVGRE